MPVSTTLPLSRIATVTVTISAAGAVAPSFNTGLYIGTSAAIPSVGANSRLREYNQGSWSEEMLADGFTEQSPEYLAMQIYFSQQPAPQNGYVGRQDLTAVGAWNIADAGAGYKVNDVVTIGGAGHGAQLLVSAVDNTGAITAAAFVPGAQGTGYQVANAVATLGGLGSGFAVNVTALGESALEAVTACRLANADWYAVAVDGASKADHLAILQYAQAVQPPVMYHFVTSDGDVLTGAAGNVFLSASAQSFNHGLGVYSTTQAGLAPGNVFAHAATMGVAMGLNTGLAGSYFTMKFKNMVGITPEPLTVTQANLIESQNGNVFVSYANGDYTFTENGTTPDGQFYDEVIFVDMLISQLQYNTADEFTTQRAIPRTNAGQQSMLKAANRAADLLASIGFIQGGTWQGQTILGGGGTALISNGQALPKGYLAISDSFAYQTDSQKKVRAMMPVYLCILEGEAGHSAIIGVNIQQ